MGGSIRPPLASSSLTTEEFREQLRALRQALGVTGDTITPEQVVAVSDLLDDADATIGGQRWAEYNRKFNALLNGSGTG